MRFKKAVTLMEMLVVIIIFSILVTISLASYGSGKEKTLDKEAVSNLKLLQSAEKLYRVEMYNYYPSSGTQSDIDTINYNLKVKLVAGSSRSWDYTVKYTGCSYATRKGGDGRSWYLEINSLDPSSGTCP